MVNGSLCSLSNVTSAQKKAGPKDKVTRSLGTEGSLKLSRAGPASSPFEVNDGPQRWLRSNPSVQHQGTDVIPDEMKG